MSGVIPSTPPDSPQNPLFAGPNAQFVERLRDALADRYVIDGEVGSGGMATVYGAEDIRHRRRVAIKLLRPELSAILGAERFLNEIRVTAHLQHPHILQLLDSGDVGGLLYYIMPYVEGESLRARCKRERQLPVVDAIRIAHDVAEAIDYAHRHGVIHRDIKPENILLHDGRALVADFGIALAVRNAGGPRLTETGLSVGTPSYMSPEQATGEREVDARSDIYSLGCVLYEMLVGEPPHTAPTVQALMQRVLMENPRPILELRETVPDHVAAATHTALAKLPADRFATAGQFAEMLQVDPPPQFRSGNIPGMRATRPRARAPWAVTAGVALAALLAGVAAAKLLGRGARVNAPLPSRLSIMVPGGSRGAGLTLARQIAITPDGEAVVYVSRQVSGAFALSLQRLDASEPTSIMDLGVAAAGDPPQILTPPDGSRLIFSQRNVLYELPFGGGPPTALDIPATPFAAWQADGTTWYNHPGTGALHKRVGSADSVVLLADSLGRPRIQQVLPGGRTALLVLMPPGVGIGKLFVLDLDTRKRRAALETPVIEARYTAGHLIYASLNNSLNAQPFDAKSGRASGSPVRIASDVTISSTGIAQFAVAENGTVVYTPNQPGELVLVDRSGAAHSALDARRSFHNPRFSPDGKRIAMDFSGPDGRDVWVLDLEQRTQTRVTFDTDGHDPIWSGDGRTIFYVSRKTGVLGMYVVKPGGSEAPEGLFTSPELGWTGTPVAGSGDLVTVMVGAKGIDIVRLKNGGRGPAQPVVATPFEEAWPAVSTDGRWLAFASNQSGQQEVYVRALDGDGELTQISTNGGSEPVWSKDGRELFYRRTSGGEVHLMAARVSPGPVFRVLGRSALFSAGMLDPAQPHANYDVSPDGRTFVAVRRDAAMRLVVLQNISEMARRARR